MLSCSDSIMSAIAEGAEGLLCVCDCSRVSSLAEVSAHIAIHVHILMYIQARGSFGIAE
jgi:hypothetical protein